MQYADADLNGNPESNLKLAFADIYSLSIISTGGSVDAVNNRVTRNFTNYTTLGKITAIAQPAGCTNVPALPGLITQTPSGNVCPGQMVTFSVPVVSNATSYQWIPPANTTIVSGQGTNTLTVLIGAGFIGSTIVVRSFNDCGNSKDRKSYVNPGSQPAVPLPISGPVEGLCGGVNVSYVVTPVAGVTYNWSFNTPAATIASGQGTNAIMATFDSSQFVNRTVSVTAANGCGTSVARTLGGLQSVPNTPGTVTGPSSVCARQNNVGYTVSSSSPAGTMYQWRAPVGSRISDGVTTSATNMLNTPSNAVTVSFGTLGGQVRVRAMNGCGNSPYSNLDVAVGCSSRGLANEQAPAAIVTLYPNPADETLKVGYVATTNGRTHITIVDALGRLMMQREYAAEAGENLATIDLSAIVPGTYFLVLQQEGATQSFRQSFIRQ